MFGGLDEDTWHLLISRIRHGGHCTPFIGAGACYGTLPLGSELARSWAEDFGFSFGNRDSLIEIGQYLAVRFDPLKPKELIRDVMRGKGPPDFSQPDEPHGMLAELPLSVYVTTNYDDFLFRALSQQQFREPVRDFCRWHDAIRDSASPLTADFDATPGRPLVYHIHGMLELDEGKRDPQNEITLLQSLVLIEDDYLEFLASLASNEQLLPAAVNNALRKNTCLFIGYRLADWNLRVLLQALRTRLATRSIAVLPPPGETEEARAAATKYFDEYYRRALDLRVYWGTASEFCLELRERLAAVS